MDMDNRPAEVAEALLKNLYALKKDEVFVITADEGNDKTVIETVVAAAKRLGAKVLAVYMPTPDGVGMAADDGIAGDALVGALAEADAWAEFNTKWIFGGRTYIRIMENNKKLRHMNLTGASLGLINNCIAKVDYDSLRKFGLRLVEMIRDGKNFRMTSPTSMDLVFSNVADRPILCELGEAYKPGTYMLPGQIAWTPDVASVNGTIVFDGALAPLCGIPSAPVKVDIRDGQVQRFYGAPEAEQYYEWLKSYHDDQMMKISHTGLGINPGARLSGDILQDQRVWGSATWAFGSIGTNLLPPDGIPGASHSDCVALHISLWIDDEEIIREGQIVHPELTALAEGLA